MSFISLCSVFIFFLSFISFDSNKVLFPCGVSFMHCNYKIFLFSLQALQIYLPGFLSLGIVLPAVFIKESTGGTSKLLLLLALLCFQRASARVHLIYFFSSAMYITHAYVSSIQWKHHRENEFYEIGRKFAGNSGLCWCYIAISSKGSKCTRPFALFNLKENYFIRKKRTITLDVGECQSLMKPAEETNWVYGCRLAFRRWGCKRDLMVGWIIEILVTMLNNYSSSRDQSSADWTPSSC